jgi:hypothetical protein
MLYRPSGLDEEGYCHSMARSAKNISSIIDLSSYCLASSPDNPMTAANSQASSQAHPLRPDWAMSSELLIGLLVPAVLLGTLGAKALADVMVQLGRVSEQLYRGERLPTLHISHPDETAEG